MDTDANKTTKVKEIIKVKEFDKEKKSITVSIFKNLWKGVCLIFTGLLISVIYLGKGAELIDNKIKEKKKKDIELKKKIDEIQSEIDADNIESEKIEEIIGEKEEDFSNFIADTKDEAKIFEREKEELRNASSDTDANIEWVKNNFGGTVVKND